MVRQKSDRGAKQRALAQALMGRNQQQERMPIGMQGMQGMPQQGFVPGSDGGALNNLAQMGGQALGTWAGNSAPSGPPTTSGFSEGGMMGGLPPDGGMGAMNTQMQPPSPPPPITPQLPPSGPEAGLMPPPGMPAGMPQMNGAASSPGGMPGQPAPNIPPELLAQFLQRFQQRGQ